MYTYSLASYPAGLQDGVARFGTHCSCIHVVTFLWKWCVGLTTDIQYLCDCDIASEHNEPDHVCFTHAATL